ncbi:hypothetical protein ACTHGU_01845 [Chitinophagaceae bacterium MMS25-I14]
MEKGCYIVQKNPDKPDDIIFSIKSDIDQVSELQQRLHLEIEKTLVVVRKLFEKSPIELQQYFAQLLTLAQAGLVPENAQPAISLNALQQLKSEIVDIKSGEVKNSYFKNLGVQALWLGIPPLCIAFILKGLNYFIPNQDSLSNLGIFANFIFVWCSSLLGIWISFGARKTILSFEELITIEEDRLEPKMRMLFSGSIALIFSLLFYKQAITINFGTVSSTSISNDAFVAMIFGVLLGLSEQILGKKITKKAASLFDNV